MLNLKVEDLMNQYETQTRQDFQAELDDEIRAEADLVAECCQCMRVCCITRS